MPGSLPTGLAGGDLPSAAGGRHYTLHLVRHGQSTWNLERRAQGQQDAPELTDLGRRQAAEAAAALSGSGATLLLTSDLTRAVQTAEIIGKATGLVPIRTALLRELGLGSLEGLTSDEVGAALTGIDLAHPDTPYGDGESRNDVLARVRQLLAAGPVAAARPGEEVIMVSHGDTIRIAVAHLLGEHPVTGPWRPIENGSVTTIRPGAPADVTDNR